MNFLRYTFTASEQKLLLLLSFLILTGSLLHLFGYTAKEEMNMLMKTVAHESGQKVYVNST
jgi:uncharacterized membrane protein